MNRLRWLLALILLLPSASSAQRFADEDVIWLVNTPDTADFPWANPSVTKLASGGYLATGLTVPYLAAEYDADGAFLRYHGGFGQGPGEFTQILAATSFRDGFAVLSRGRVTLFSGDGTYLDAAPAYGGRVTAMTEGRFAVEAYDGPADVLVLDDAAGLSSEVVEYGGDVKTQHGAFIRGQLVGFELDGTARDRQGDPLGWNLVEGIPNDFDGDPMWAVQGATSRGGMVFVSKAYEPGRQGLWSRSPAGTLTRIDLPDDWFPFVSGDVIGVFRQDELGTVSVGILPL